jgi:hypothetical protein
MPEDIHVDARTFQEQLSRLAETLSYKVEREGLQYLPIPAFVHVDISVLLRQAHATYNLFFYLNADERRHKDPDWRVAYTAAALPLIRCMIDCLYNITTILNNPGSKGYQFRLSGFKKVLEALDADEKNYGGDPGWDAHISEMRKNVDFGLRSHGMTEVEARATKLWPTLSGYLRSDKNIPPTSHQEFLRALTFGFWDNYSGMAHATFQGLLETAVFYMPRTVPHEHRPFFDTVIVERMIARHITRVAAILLCTLTEVQAHFRFDGANINTRLHQIWGALTLLPEIKELYDKRYAKIMQEKGINPD